MDILDFRKVFDFIQSESPSTKLNDTELKSVWKQFNDWKGQALTMDSISGCLDDDCNDCMCEPETCKMIKGKCKNLAYR